MKNNTIKTKMATLEVLERLMDALEILENDVSQKIVWIETDEPRLDDEGNPRTREDGSIIYKQDYKYEKIAEKDLSDEEKLKLKAIEEVRKQLEKLA